MADVGWYRWMVLLASFLVHAIFGCILDGGAAFHVLFLNAFHGGSGATAVVTSLNGGIFYGVGPLAGMLVNRFLCWKVAFVGGLIVSFGLSISACVSSLPDLYLTFGVIAGLGMGIAYMPTLTVVSQVFDEKRTVAFGIMSSGVGIGKFVIAPLLQYLESKYGWQGAILLMGGLSLNLCACAMIYFRPGLQTPLPVSGTEKDSLDLPLPNEDFKPEPHQLHDSKCEITSTEDIPNNSELKSSNGVQPRSLNGALLRVNMMDRVANAGSVVSLSGSMSSVKVNNGLKNSTLEVNFANSLHNPENIEAVKKEIAMGGSMAGLHGAYSASSLYLNSLKNCSIEGLPPSHSMLNNCKQMGSFHSKLGALRMSSNLNSTNDIAISNETGETSIPTSNFASSINMADNGIVSHDVCDNTMSTKKIILFLLTNPSFMVLCVNNLLFGMGFSVSNVHLAAFSMTLGLTQEEGGYLISAFGLASIVGKIGLGILANTGYISPMSVYVTTFFACGVASMVLPLCQTFTNFIIFSIFFGACSSSFGAVLPTIVVAMTTVERLPLAYGMLLSFEAAAFFLGPTIGGWLFDWSGKYAASFYFGGITMMVSAIIMIYPWFAKPKSAKQKPQIERELSEIPEV